MSFAEERLRATASDMSPRALDLWLASCAGRAAEAERGSLEAGWWHDLCVLLAGVRDERRALAEQVDDAMMPTVDLGEVEDDPDGAA